MEIPGVPLLAVTMVGLFAAVATCIVFLVRGRTGVARSIAMISVAWIAAYASLLVVTSLASRERTLAIGETKRFCGFYLDCHMGVAVERVDTVSSIGDMRAGGTFYVVTLRVSSDARRAALRLEEPRITIVDGEGFRYERSAIAEQKLSLEMLDLERPVEAGHSFTRAIVIDVPHGVRHPRLHVTMGGALDRAVERALIGDEEALLHAPTLHSLVAGSGVSSASAGVR